MTNALLLKLHRWISLVFALPLLLIIVTGLILAVEPMVQAESIRPGSVDATRVAALVQRYDPDGKARGVFLDSASGRLRLQGTSAPEIDLSTGEAATTPSRLTDFFFWARRTHHHLLDMEWLITASTIAMTLAMVLGVLMGLPRLRNSLSGWHKGAAWLTLPVILLSPLSALCMAFGLTFMGEMPPAGKPVRLADAITLVAQVHDLAAVRAIGQRGGRVMAQIREGGELKNYAVTSSGVTLLPRNWPRLIHEGNWSAMIAGPLNVLVSVVLLLLLGTGVVIWARRSLRRRSNRARARVVSDDAAIAGSAG